MWTLNDVMNFTPDFRIISGCFWMSTREIPSESSVAMKMREEG